MSKDYTSKSITVLKGLEPVRARPGMYIGGTDLNGLHHLVWEALDNAVDEAINGHCKNIDVTLGAGGRVIVTDDGRGIPVDIHKQYKKPALELIMTTLHAGAKFDNKSYSSSGGLHGVGISVVNALAETMDVTIFRDGHEWMQSFSRGKPTSGLRKVKVSRKRGTAISFVPDGRIFNKIDFSFKTVCAMARSKTFINRGLRITVRDERTDSEEIFYFERGIRDYIIEILAGKKGIFEEPFYAAGDNHIHCEAALQWTESTESRIESYCNSIHTVDGGAHEAGLRAALVKTIRREMERRKSKPVPITVEDVKEGLTAVLSVFVKKPQFQGQTKEKLNNPEVAGQVENILKPLFEQFLIENPSTAADLLARVELSAKARMASRAAREEVQRKGAISHRLTLPGKLADCQSTNPADSELFIVEGDSAGGSSKQARDRRTQAILPLRGKILNVENASGQKLVNNAELKALILTIGTGFGKDFNIKGLRYGKIIIMSDADVDGAHISVLLLTFFFRYMKPLVERGHIYLSVPPLYRITIGKEVFYATDDIEKQEILALHKNRKPDVARFKGLGEMPVTVLKETTMSRKKRTLLRVELVDEKETETAFSELMGKEPALRFRFIQANSAGFELDV